MTPARTQAEPGRPAPAPDQPPARSRMHPGSCTARDRQRDPRPPQPARLPVPRCCRPTMRTSTCMPPAPDRALDPPKATGGQYRPPAPAIPGRGTPARPRDTVGGRPRRQPGQPRRRRPRRPRPDRPRRRRCRPRDPGHPAHPDPARPARPARRRSSSPPPTPPACYPARTSPAARRVRPRFSGDALDADGSRPPPPGPHHRRQTAAGQPRRPAGPPATLIATCSHAACRARLRAITQAAAAWASPPIVLGSWPAGITCQVAADGLVATATPADQGLDGLRLFHLGGPDATAITGVLREAHGARLPAPTAPDRPRRTRAR